MAKKISGAKTSLGRADLPVSQGEGEAAQQRRPTTKKINSLAPSDGERVAEGRVRARPSALLDTRVVYCGDNLESAGRRQKDEG
jgi:hypothetical protein